MIIHYLNEGEAICGAGRPNDWARGDLFAIMWEPVNCPECLKLKPPAPPGAVVKDLEPALQDTDLMPFGEHIGKRMMDVPARYFHWLWTHGKKSDKHCLVAAYIRRNLNALKQEHPDGLWD